MIPYNSYKEIKAGWINRIPQHWEAMPVKYVCSYNDDVISESTDNETLIDYIEISDVDEILGVTGSEIMPFKDAPSRARRKVKHGDVLISTVRTYLRSVASVNSPPNNLVVSTGFVVLRPQRIDVAYARYALVTEGFIQSVISRSTGVSYPAINATDLVRIPIPVPPSDEQFAIAAYLDAETTRIDGLIQEKHRLLAALDELRETRISEILTGFGKETTPSGNEWIPSIPDGWELKRLKHLGQIRSGIAKGKKYEGQNTIEIPYLRVANVQDGHLDLTEISVIEVSENEAQRYLLEVGDVLMNEGGDYDKLGRGAVWKGEIAPCIHQNHVFAVRTGDLDLSNWISAITQTAYAKFYFLNNAKQSTNLASINQTNVKELPILLPPEEIRNGLLAQLQDELHRISALVQHTRAEISLLTELRSATITDAVLGRIDVRNHIKNK